MIFLSSLLCILFCGVTASVAEGQESVVSCHCFQERTFDPQKKFAADNYLLTTNFNSFLAASFHISKSQIVMMKMKEGVGSSDLLIALYVARACQVQLVPLFAILDNGGSWRNILQSETILRQECRDDLLVALVDADEQKELVGICIVDQLLKEYFGVSERDIIALRKKGASAKEITLLFNLERYVEGEIEAAELLSMYEQREMSWGEIAWLFGLSPKGAGKLFLQEGASAGMR